MNIHVACRKTIKKEFILSSSPLRSGGIFTFFYFFPIHIVLFSIYFKIVPNVRHHLLSHTHFISFCSVNFSSTFHLLLGSCIFSSINRRMDTLKLAIFVSKVFHLFARTHSLFNFDAYACACWWCEWPMVIIILYDCDIEVPVSIFLLSWSHLFSIFSSFSCSLLYSIFSVKSLDTQMRIEKISLILFYTHTRVFFVYIFSYSFIVSDI